MKRVSWKSQRFYNSDLHTIRCGFVHGILSYQWFLVPLFIPSLHDIAEWDKPLVYYSRHLPSVPNDDVLTSPWGSLRSLAIFSSAWLCQQSSWNQNSSVVLQPVARLCHQRLSLNLSHGFLSNFISWLPWTICPGVFWIFEKKSIFLIFLTNIFRFR